MMEESTLADVITMPVPGNSTALMDFSAWYRKQHGYISILVCTFGIISNIMNIIVLLQKHMISPTNILLVGIAVADFMTMAVYVPYVAYFYFYSVLESENHPYPWLVVLIASTCLILTFHTVSLWLTVSLAVFRYIVVCHHVHGPRLCNVNRAYTTLIIVTIVSVIICIPNYLNNEITARTNTNDSIVKYEIGFSYLNVITDRIWWRITLWLYSMFFKIVPCIILIVLSALLIRAIHLANQRRRRLFSKNRNQPDDESSEHNRTTVMLIVVVLSFVLIDLPQGIVVFWALCDPIVFTKIYNYLGDVFDILVLINSAINFILYCIMSHQFRTTFKQIFFKRLHSPQRGTKRSKATSVNGTDYTVVLSNDVTTV